MFRYLDLLQVLKVTYAEVCFFMSSENVERERESDHNILIHAKRSKHAYVRKVSERFTAYFCVSSWSK